MRNILVLSAALALSGCANVCVRIATPAGASCWPGNIPAVYAAPVSSACGTDTECKAQCAVELRPDEDPTVCMISLAPVQ